MNKMMMMNKKRSLSQQLLAAAALTLTVSMPILAQPPVVAANYNEAFQSVQNKLRDKKYSEALAEAEQVLQIAELPVNDKVRFLNAVADGYRRQLPPNHTAASATYEKIVADAGIPNNARVAALKNVADVFMLTLSGQNLDQMDISPAYTILERALQLPELKPEESAIALRNIAALAERADNYPRAQQAYQQILELQLSDRTKQQAQQLLANTYASQGNEKQALALYRQYNLDPIALYIQMADSKKTTEEIVRVLDNANADDKEKWEAFRKLPIFGQVIRDTFEERDAFDTMIVLGRKYLPTLLETDPARATVLLARFKQTPISSTDMRKTLSIHPEFIVWAAPLLLKTEKLSDADYTQVKEKYIEALASQRQFPQAVAGARELAGDARVPATTRLWAQFVAQAGSPAAIAKTLKSAEGISEKDQANALLRASQVTLRLENEPAARRLLAAYEGLLKAPAQAVIPCAFVPNAPNDVGGWLASPLLKDAKKRGKMNRAYGDNLQILLDTDASTTGRQAGLATKEPTGDSDTDFYVACDEDGLNFFIYAYDQRIREVKSGLVKGGAFEMYLAPGAHQSYYTFLPRLPDARLSTGIGSFTTMYPNAQFRLPSVEAGTLRTEARTTDKGTAMAFSLGWELFYDKLPSNGDKWQFESIRWTRSGGLSFGGSESVHNRSSWGDMVFSGLTPQNVNAIKRALVFKAVTKYRAAKDIAMPVGNWADADLGDPVFYATKVEPLLKTLDAHAAKVSKDMSAAEVETLFRDAVPGWMELVFNVAALRTQYLKEKQLN